MRWAIYVRKSDDDKKVTEKSIGEQLKEARTVAERDDLTVAEEYEESQSAKIPYVRPHFTKLMKQIEKGEIQGILCWHVNRLARNMAEGGLLAHYMAEGKLREIRTPTTCYKTGDSILPLVFETGSSTQFSLDVVRSVSRGLRGHFERGGTTYKAPAGYRNQRDPDNLKRGIVIVDEPRFALIKRGFEMLLTGAYTVSQVRTTLNETWGYRSREGEPLSPGGAYKLFRDPYYAGFVRFNGDVRKGLHTPMLSEAEFTRAQEIIESTSKPRQKAVKPDRKFAFTGLMRCAYCGQQVTAEHHKLTSGKTHTTYRCCDSWRRCTKKGMSLELLEAALAEEICSIQINEKLVDITLKTILRDLEIKHTELLADYSRENTGLKQVEKKLWKLEEMFFKGLLESEERYLEHLAALKAERERFTVRAEGTRLTLDEARESAHNTARFILRAKKAFLDSDEKTKREIVMALATGYKFYGREKKIELTLDPLLDGMVRFARTRATSAQPVVRTSGFSENGLFEVAETSSETKKNAPAREAFFSGGPAELQVGVNQLGDGMLDMAEIEPFAEQAPDELLELFFTRMFPKIDFDLPLSAMVCLKTVV